MVPALGENGTTFEVLDIESPGITRLIYITTPFFNPQSQLQKSDFNGARVFQPAIFPLLAGKKTRPPLLLHRLKVILQLPPQSKIRNTISGLSDQCLAVGELAR